jgi:uncharacterized protein (DUF983 family)
MTTPVSPFGRSIAYGAVRDCPHRHRLLGRLRFVNGSLHIADICLACGGRTDSISRRDLAAAGIDWLAIPLVRDNAAEAA